MGLQSMNVWEEYTTVIWNYKMEYKWIIYMQRNENEIYVHSHFVLNTALRQWNEMEKQIRAQLLKLLTTNTTNY